MRVFQLSSWLPPTPRALLLLVALAPISTSPGCASRTFRADQLPPELAAPATVNLDTINLSGLASSSVSTEVIQPGDVLDVTMITDYRKLDTTTTPVRVADDGMVVIPLVGKVSVGGMEVERAEQAINAESIDRGIFRNPCITLTMKQCRTTKVTVVGAVNKPGVLELPRGNSSLMAALTAADGLTKDAGAEVEIRHTDSRQAVLKPSTNAPQVAYDQNGKVIQTSFEQTVPGSTPGVTTVDLMAAAGGTIQVPELHDGDVVNVAKRNLPSVYVMGLVTKPGQFDFPPSQELRVLDAIAMAGGVSNPVAEDVIVIRKVDGAPEPVRIAVSIQNAKNGRDNIALAPGDTVTIEQTPATVVIDVFRSFIRFSVGSSVNWF